MSFRLSLRRFKKSLPNTFIYESILIKIYMRANIMNTQIFHLIKYEGHKMSLYVYSNLNLRSYGQLFMMFCQCKQISSHQKNLCADLCYSTILHCQNTQ